jgi:alpha-glucosidase
VKAAMFDVVRFWMDRGSTDCASTSRRDREGRSATRQTGRTSPTPARRACARSLVRSPGPSRDRGHPDVHRSTASSVASSTTTATGSRSVRCTCSAGTMWASFYGELDEMHMPFNFGLLKTPWRADPVRANGRGRRAGAPPGAGRTTSSAT